MIDINGMDPDLLSESELCTLIHDSAKASVKVRRVSDDKVVEIAGVELRD